MAKQQNYWSTRPIISNANPGKSPEKSLVVPDNKSVIVGLAIRVKDANVHKLAIQVATLGVDANNNPVLNSVNPVWNTSDGKAFDAKDYEQIGSVPAGDVLVGFGFRVKDNNVKTLALYSRKWNGTSLQNSTSPAMGADVTTTWIPAPATNPPEPALEKTLYIQTDPNLVVIGVGAACRDSNASGIWLATGSVNFGTVPPSPAPPDFTPPPNPENTQQAHGCIQWSSIEGGFYAFFQYGSGTCPNPDDLPDYNLGTSTDIQDLESKLGQPGTLVFIDLTAKDPNYPSFQMRGKPAKGISFTIDQIGQLG